MEIKNLGHAMPDLVVSQPQSSRKQTHVKKCNHVIYAKHKWFSGCAERNTILSPYV